MYDILDVSKYAINYSIQIDKPISNLKLQKVLYYIQAKFLIEKNEPCFEAEIENWRHGPVIPRVYRNFKKYFNSDIKIKQENTSNFKENDRQLIESIIISYKDVDAWDMVNKTHKEDPWLSTERNEIISKESIKNYFEVNKNRIMG